MPIVLLDLAFGFVDQLLKDHGQKLPAELTEAAQAAVDAWAKHRADVVTKAALEAQRAS